MDQSHKIFQNYIRMSVSLLLLNLPPLKFPYGVIRILVVGGGVRRVDSVPVSDRELL